METETYYLPSGRAVAIHADVSRGRSLVSYQIADGSTVLAADSEARRRLLLNIDASLDASLEAAAPPVSS